MAANLEQEMVNQNIDLTLKKGKHAPVKQTTVLSNLFGNFNATKNLDHNNAAHGFESTKSPEARKMQENESPSSPTRAKQSAAIAQQKMQSQIESRKGKIKNKLEVGIASEMVKHLKMYQELANKFRDRTYKEIDGYYIVIKGHIDIVSHKIRGKKLQEISLLEGFGESSFLQVPSFEYVGDLYAGFSHSGSDHAKKITSNLRK